MLIRKFFKFKNSPPKAFMGIIDLDENFDRKFEERFTSHYRNAMVISKFQSGFIKKLIEVSMIHTCGCFSVDLFQSPNNYSDSNILVI